MQQVQILKYYVSQNKFLLTAAVLCNDVSQPLKLRERGFKVIKK